MQYILNYIIFQLIVTMLRFALPLGILKVLGSNLCLETGYSD